eukprot:CAMPEP_0175923494 /NCGR_PEP_ID=MMETSP0108-20121206/14601_1 /TAXON_ID=195067 ORGANISM="Goniomonas pacifica, Strain CCMP1869" /NCGR_SAMPLE_ID=MMETSP0108 /ASSEMBLY_ACC=CAM_ASM_000204 /LENGTH=41 /DNA_ID= /DNA_START= /DNA_END= /DNA_ORIENTATION=
MAFTGDTEAGVSGSVRGVVMSRGVALGVTSGVPPSSCAGMQ